MYDILQLNEMLVPELKEIAEKLQVKEHSKKLNKQDLIYKILDAGCCSRRKSSGQEETTQKAEKRIRSAYASA